MCRFTAYVGSPIPVSALVFSGSHSLYRQSWAPIELLSGSVNADGWGVAWYRGERPVRLARAEPVWYDQGLEPVLASLSAPMAMAAVRNATVGLPIGADATAPLVLGRWSFVLNGFVPSFRMRHMRSLRARLPDPLYGELKGVSDTETLFLLSVAALEGGSSPADALQWTAELVLSEVGSEEECQLTMVLADGDSLAVLRTSNVERVNSLYRLTGSGLGRAGTLIASERLDDDEAWTPVPARSAMELRPDPAPRPRDPSPSR